MPLPPLVGPQDFRLRAQAAALEIPVAAGLFGTLMGANAMQVSSLLVRPFSRRAFRRINRFVANTWWGWVVSTTQVLYDAELIVTGDEVPERENAIVVSNHQQMPDIPVLMAFARTQGRLGDMKWFVKDVLKYVPGVGWGMLFLDCLFVQRNWSDDEANIDATFKRIVQDDVPIWLISFVEGTRMRPDRLEASRRFAQERGLPLPEHTLVPRTKGFNATVSGLREHVDAVYDFTIGYVDGVPDLRQWFQGCSKRVHLHVRRYPVETLPTSNDELAQWLMDRFEEKDALLAGYYEDGHFPGEERRVPARVD